MAMKMISKTLFYPALYDDVKCSTLYVVGDEMTYDEATRYLHRYHRGMLKNCEAMPIPVDQAGAKCRLTKDPRNYGTDALAKKQGKLVEVDYDAED